MTLEQFAEISEIAGSVAVIGSLIFFGMEFRKNTKVQEAVAFQGSIANDLEILLKLGENTETARLFFAYRDVPDGPRHRVLRPAGAARLSAVSGDQRHRPHADQGEVTADERPCERFHKTILDEFYKVAFRKKIYEDLESLQADLDTWIDYYNNERTHQGKMCCGRTPMQTLEDGKEIWKEKKLS